MSYASTHPLINAFAIIMPDKKINAVLFDLGDTLLNFGRVKTTQLFMEGSRASYDFLENLGLPVRNFRYHCWLNLVLLHLRRWAWGIIGRDFDTLALLKKVGARKRLRLEEQQWLHLAWLMYQPLSRIAQVEPNISQTLTALKNLGLKLGIVTNTCVNGCFLERNLKELGILDFFTVRVYSYEFNFRKPNTRIFKIAADRIGELSENILFVGDRINKDIKPAIKSGMRAVLKAAYTNAGKKTPKGAWKIQQLSELPALIEKINATGIDY
jgi:HAD superfamily hydrolase (TIGR01549 family)